MMDNNALHVKIKDFMFGFLLSPMLELSILWAVKVLSEIVIRLISSPSNFINNPLRDPVIGFLIILTIPTILNILAIYYLHKKSQYLTLGMVAGTAVYYSVIKIGFLYGLF